MDKEGVKVEEDAVATINTLGFMGREISGDISGYGG